jgi:hypothetical protein
LRIPSSASSTKLRMRTHLLDGIFKRFFTNQFSVRIKGWPNYNIFFSHRFILQPKKASKIISIVFWLINKCRINQQFQSRSWFEEAFQITNDSWQTTADVGPRNTTKHFNIYQYVTNVVKPIWSAESPWQTHPCAREPREFVLGSNLDLQIKNNLRACYQEKFLRSSFGWRKRCFKTKIEMIRTQYPTYTPINIYFCLSVYIDIIHTSIDSSDKGELN